MIKKFFFIYSIFLSLTNLYSNSFAIEYFHSWYRAEDLKQVIESYIFKHNRNTDDLWKAYYHFHQTSLTRTITIRNLSTSLYEGFLIWRYPFKTIKWETVVQKLSSLPSAKLTQFLEDVKTERDMTCAEVELCHAPDEETRKELLLFFEFLLSDKVSFINIREYDTSEEVAQTYLGMGYVREGQCCSLCKRYCWKKKTFDNGLDEISTESPHH